MKIVVNTRSLIPNRLDGIGWFTFQIFRRMVQMHPEVEFHFLFDRPFAQKYVFAPNVKPVVLWPPARHPFLYLIYYEWSVRRYLKRVKPDLFIAPDGMLSLGSGTKQLAVMHDINFLHYPQDLAYFYSKYYNLMMPRFARKAEGIVTVSNFSRDDIQHNFHVPAEKIGVVYNGIHEGYRLQEEGVKQHMREKYSDDKPYFLFVGSLSPRKNLLRLVHAFNLFKQQTGAEHRLLLIGASFWGEAELHRIINGLEHGRHIHLTGRLEQDELVQVMGSAFALTFVSYFEGFGIPLVEAMASGVPVICSNTSCMPEIAGDAALYADPFNPEEIASQMKQLVNNPELANHLVAKGLQQCRRYDWDASAKKMWEEVLRTIQPR